MTAGYFLFGAIFALSVLACVGLTLLSSSRWRFLSPVTLAMAIAAGYMGLGVFIGLPKPSPAFPGWDGPSFGPEGAVVIGAKMEPNAIYILLQEDGRDTPRLFAFAADHEMARNMKKAMDQTAREQQGNPWGFRMKPNGQKPEGQGGRQGRDGRQGQGEHETDGDAQGGEPSLEDRENSYRFDPPQPKIPQPKALRQQPGFREFHSQ